MSVSGIVITFAREADLAARARAAIAREEWLEYGVPAGSRLPAVIEAPDPRAARELVERLVRLPGVASVDVVFVGTEDSAGESGLPSRGNPHAGVPVAATSDADSHPNRTERGTP
jgi:hypothetical protein